MQSMRWAIVAVLVNVLAVSQVLATGVLLPDFRPIVEENTPAVVKILVEYDQQVSDARAEEEIPEYLRRFFEFRGGPPQQQRQSMGSGFIISEDGYVVTNNHVVEGASSIIVRLTDRSEYVAEVVGLDPRSDLALLRLEASGLPVLKLGKPGELQVGEWVLAIGSPFGLDYSVTAGIVSAKGRSLPNESNDNYVPFIQTDVAINPGNSGGPLFNLEGEVVGVNSQIFTRSGGSIGLSFAIPVSVVHNVVTQLRETGQVTRGWLGVTIQDVDKNLAESFGLDRPRGALVTQLQPDGPAAKAGIEAGDVIVTFDGIEIPTSTDLPHVVGLVPPGTKARVEVIRDGRSKTLKVKVGGLDADEKPSIALAAAEAESGSRLGLQVREVDAELQTRWGISGGVVVAAMESGGAGERAGIQAGDVITLVGSTPINSVQAFVRAVDKIKPGKSTPLRLIRRGSPLFIGLKLE
ncbi:DegQ family serine endoprotease [Halieaceae bacterium IMCC14734]|uniref:Probable periplasmic serine endoprotease DegP-like n=2 Tax=Candidatus Litorirhabdus singularis TaxID=2518993 RepID=A0ABT3THU1_9GAMM|nr:DegQ family serine endoprotease [Candidatus Litorirhabdus singularis]MCX2981846.1 DegQ family serine endoprotease [Candidatus Litorirhabdus singularis]